MPLPSLKSLFAGGVGQAVSGVVDSAKSLISQFKLSPEQEKEFLLKMEVEANRHMETFQANAIKEIELANADRDSADMQKAALAQSDLFAKRFLYYLAAFVVLSSVGYGVSLLFVEVPEENKRLVEQFSDMFLLTGALMVLGFFFGSSKSSHDKTAAMNREGK